MRPVALLGVRGKRARVDREPLRITDARSKGARHKAVRHAMTCGERQRTTHVEKWGGLLQTVRSSKRSLVSRRLTDKTTNSASAGMLHLRNRGVEVVTRNATVTAKHPSAIDSRDMNA